MVALLSQTKLFNKTIDTKIRCLVKNVNKAYELADSVIIWLDLLYKQPNVYIRLTEKCLVTFSTLFLEKTVYRSAMKVNQYLLAH